MVGTDYGPPPDNPITRAIGRMFGAPPPASDEAVIRGNPGSSGKVRGIARVINTIDEADRLGVGEILVVPTTSPPWTPLFGIASAVVTDTGGPLSHCAVVCREYGIPGVVGTQVGTSKIRDGQTIEVDGDAGLCDSCRTHRNGAPPGRPGRSPKFERNGGSHQHVDTLSETANLLVRALKRGRRTLTTG